MRRQYGSEACAGSGNSYTRGAKVAELESLIGQRVHACVNETIEIALPKEGLSLNAANAKGDSR
jgi:hypothetical protein